MDSRPHDLFTRWLPLLIAGAALATFLAWMLHGTDKPLEARLPGADAYPESLEEARGNPVLLGATLPGVGTAGTSGVGWPQFRGLRRDGTAAGTNLAARWPGDGLPALWTVEVGEGYAGPAIADGRVFLMDYDREAKTDALRCLSLVDGQEVWRFTYPINVKRNHGMTRTVPAVASDRVVAIGPKCHVVSCGVQTGDLQWTLDLVQEFGTTVPEWYAGQCPLIDGDRVILAPGGPEALLLAVRLDDGEVLWQTPNPRGWKMTHSSIMPMEFGGERQYVYCANKGVVGVSATDGRLLWSTPEWKISIATVPSPCVLEGDRIFLSGGYNAGSMMLRLERGGEGITAKPLFRLDADVFGATQQSPIMHENHIYGVRPDGRLVCLALDGTVVWDSGSADTFGLGPFLIAGDLIYALDDSGLLRLVRARPATYEKLAEARVLEGRESWGPMALVDNRLLVRDFTRLTCLDVGAR
jgi:outer membrane protein assembly factor BamB